MKAYEAELSSRDKNDEILGARIVELEKKIESMKGERLMLNQALSMTKEKLVTLSSQKKNDSPGRVTPQNVSAIMIDDGALKRKDDECNQKLAALQAKLEKALKEKELIVGELDRKQDQIVSLKGECTKYRQSNQKAVKEKEKMKTLLNELNKTFIEQGTELHDLKYAKSYKAKTAINGG